MGFLFVLVNIDIEDYIYVNTLKEYWSDASEKDAEIHLSDATLLHNILKIKPRHICTAKPIDSLSKVKLYATDSAVFVRNLRDHLSWAIWGNIIVVLFYYILTKQSPNTEQEVIEKNSIAEQMESLVKHSLGFMVVIIQLTFILSQVIFIRTRNNRLYTELTTIL
ncbi:MAG: hypothetical protein K0Q79_3755 [Flavipsychrobacter sp.]|jgi:hypothetical protein|nr:hypothetical protein [Flavipsychrobacter sp.]